MRVTRFCSAPVRPVQALNIETRPENVLPGEIFRLDGPNKNLDRDTETAVRGELTNGNSIFVFMADSSVRTRDKRRISSDRRSVEPVQFSCSFLARNQRFLKRATGQFWAQNRWTRPENPLPRNSSARNLSAPHGRDTKLEVERKITESKLSRTLVEQEIHRPF